MGWSRIIPEFLAMAVLSIGTSGHASDADLRTPPIPRKTLPAPALAHQTALPGDLVPTERVRYYHEQAAIQAELESSHRDAAQEWLSRLVQESRPRPAPNAAGKRWPEYVKVQADREEAAAEYHARLKRRYLQLETHPRRPVPPDIPPLPSSRGRDQDRAVLEAALNDVLGLWDAKDRGHGARRHLVLHASSLSDTMPGDFGGLLDGAGLANGFAEELQADLGRRNAGGPTGLVGLKFEDARIVVKDLGETDARTGERPDEMNGYEFRDTYPEVAGYAKAYLPGYTGDGKTSAVHMLLGPPADPHGLARYSGVIVKSRGGWRVKWKSINHPE